MRDCENPQLTFSTVGAAARTERQDEESDSDVLNDPVSRMLFLGGGDLAEP